MTDVFISYKRRLRAKVELIASRLEALGLEVWFDANLESGSTFSATISEQVRSARCVLVCWSDDAFPHGGDKHGWVIGEATIGRDRGVLVAASLEDADLDPPWNTVHTDDLTAVGGRAWYATPAWRNVLLAIGKHIGRPGLAALDRAMTSRSPRALSEWAAEYPDDPTAVGLIEAGQNDELQHELEAARAADRREGLRATQRAAATLAVIVALAIGVWAWISNLPEPSGEPLPASTPTSSREPALSLAGDVLLSHLAESSINAEAGSALALQPPAGDVKTEERLGAETATDPNTAVAAIDSSTAGSQSLLLEASDSGGSGALPFSGTVEWSKGVDETGQPTLIARASIDARDLQVDVLIRKNSDPALPASHLMEINFSTSNTFVGGSIAGLPGVLLKNEELVQGQPLVGASARVVGNSFLFALSAAPEDTNANVSLLTSRKWIDLALIYATGKRAIITLEKDSTAQALFNEVFAAWGTRATG